MRSKPARILMIALIAIACALAVDACGSGGKSQAASDGGLKFAACMRSHGVPNFPDPTPGGGGIKIPSGVDPASPSFQSAQRACQKLLPGGPPSLKGSESRKLQLVKLAQCMRRHGLTTFPDPTNSPPVAPPSGGGIAFGSPGSFLSVPQSVIQSPAFKQAAAACGFPGGGKLPGH